MSLEAKLICVRGIVGDGKSTISWLLSGMLDSVVVRSDKVRKYKRFQNYILFSDLERSTMTVAEMNEKRKNFSKEEFNKRYYSSEGMLRAYHCLNLVAEHYLRKGKRVIIDASYKTKEELDTIDELLKNYKSKHRHKLTPIIVQAICDKSIAKQRIIERKKSQKGASEADLKIREKVAKEFFYFMPDFYIDTSGGIDNILDQIHRKFQKVVKISIYRNPEMIGRIIKNGIAQYVQDKKIRRRMYAQVDFYTENWEAKLPYRFHRNNHYITKKSAA